MAKLKRFLVNASVCFLLPQLLLAGCSLIGFGIGAISDSSSRAGEEVSISELRKTASGTSVTVVMRDTRHIEGDFVTMREEETGKYRDLYSAAVQYLRVEGSVPIPGDSVTFALQDTPWLKERGRFMGVDPGAMVINQSGRRIFVADLGSLSDDSCAGVDLFTFSSLVRERRLPQVSKSVILSVNGDTTELPTADITRVEFSGGARVGKFIGLGIGAAIDAIVIVAMTNSITESCNASCKDAGGSCVKPAN